jgi:hypothetical protein
VFPVGEKTRIKELPFSTAVTSGSSISTVHVLLSPKTQSSSTAISGLFTVLLHPASKKLPNNKVAKIQIFFISSIINN